MLLNRRSLYIGTALLVIQSSVMAQSKKDSLIIPPSEFIYQKPTAFNFLKNIPGDVKDYSVYTFQKKHIPAISAMVAGTALLVIYDQYIIDRAQELGDKLDLSHSSHQRTYVDFSVNLGSKKLALPINAPSDLNTTMYFLGDGITHFSIAGGFWIYGLSFRNNRARQTASALTEAILTTGFATQFLKHLTGRESPFASTAPGGVWRVFPNQFDYADHVPAYDAYPSGHLATAMATVTVISSNYPEYKWIKPAGYSLMGVLSFAMLNNGVHWMSDYPLSIALGYAFGKIAVKKGRTAFKNPSGPSSEESVNFGMIRKKNVPEFFMGPSGPGIMLRF